MAGEKIKYGLKANQIDEILRSSKALDKLVDAKNNMTEKNYKIIKNYFTAWRNVFKNVWFVRNNTLTKSAGFRFICYLFSYVQEVLELTSSGKGRKDFRIAAFEKVVIEIKDCHFNDEFDTDTAGHFQQFQERSGIAKLANAIGKELVEKYQGKEEDILV